MPRGGFGVKEAGATADAAVATQTLTLPEELILMLLNEENGYFHQVPGWDLNCAFAGAVLAELSLLSRIDTDMESLFLVDGRETGNPILDPTLREIAQESEQRSTQYWIERLATQAEEVIDLTLERLVEMEILEHHDGGFWTLARTAWQAELSGRSVEGSVGQFVKTRIVMAVFNNEIPTPRDAIIISLVNTCDVFRFIFELDDETEERIGFICNMDVIGRSIANAVAQHVVGSFLPPSKLDRDIPRVPLRKVLLNRHLRSGHIPALFADLSKEYGPVFRLRPPFAEPMIFLAGPEMNRWAHRNGRTYLRTRDYFVDFERVYGASGVMPSLDGADHFRLRKAMQPSHSRARLAGQIDDLHRYVRETMSDWRVGDAYRATTMCRRLVNAQLSPFFIGVDSQDIFEDLASFKERALTVHIMKALPKFMLKTPGMRRRAKSVDVLLERVQGAHTSAQRAGCPRNLADDWLSLHASDPQFVPETNLRFALSAALVASVYLGDSLSFALYAMASQPELYERVRAEADALFADGDPKGSDYDSSAIDVTHRFIKETHRLYPVVPMSIRNVMNSCLVGNHELPVGARVFVAQTAAHFMEEVFPDPCKFDIDRYLPPRDEHLSPGYAPYGLGTHTCLGIRWMELQLAVNLLMIAHYFDLEVRPVNYKFKFSPLPSMKPSKRLKFLVAGQRRGIDV